MITTFNTAEQDKLKKITAEQDELKTITAEQDKLKTITAEQDKLKTITARSEGLNYMPYYDWAKEKHCGKACWQVVHLQLNFAKF